MKQEALALELGEDWTQRRISLLEQKEEIEPEILEQVAKALKVPAEAIKNFDEEAAIVNIQHNYEGSTLNHSLNYQYNFQPTFNPIDKIVTLYDEKVALLERLLHSEKEKVETLERIINERK